MKKYFALLGVVALLSIGFALMVNAAGTCDATGLYDCTNHQGDSDADGVCNSWENGWYGTDPFDPDTDGGGACDGDEVFLDSTDPTNGNDDLT